MFRFLLFCLLFLSLMPAKAQLSYNFFTNKDTLKAVSASDTAYGKWGLTDKQKLNTMLISGSVLYAGSMAVLYNAWYKDYPQTKFHLFNDNDEWFQLDKYAHAMTSYNVGYLGYNTLLWSGVNENKAIWYGGFLGSFYLTVIEILDGFSEGWGASSGDIAANATGSLIFCTQQALWKKQNIRLKYSFMPSPYAQYRPNLLGNNNLQSIFKDYNGYICWSSLNLKTFFEGHEKFPDWLCLSIGYGADGMIGATSNPTIYNGQMMPVFERKRQFYLSADIDYMRIPVKSKYLKLLFKAVSFIKLPFPTLEYSKTDKLRFHPIYF